MLNAFATPERALVSFDRDGRPSFDLLGRRMLMRDRSIRVSFLAFDLLAIEGVSTLEQPYEQRRTILEALDFAGPCWATVPRFDDGDALWSVIVDRGLEGVVAKRLRDPYRPGERGWAKTKSAAWPRRELEREAMSKGRERRNTITVHAEQTRPMDPRAGWGRKLASSVGRVRSGGSRLVLWLALAAGAGCWITAALWWLTARVGPPSLPTDGIGAAIAGYERTKEAQADARRQAVIQQLGKPGDEPVMRASIHAVRAELAANQELLFEALKAKRYWNPQRQSLRSTEWHRRRDLIGSGEREYREAYEKVERAHRQFNRMNELVEGRRASESAVGPIGAEMIPTLAIEPADRADEALQLASRAYGALGKLLDGL